MPIIPTLGRRRQEKSSSYLYSEFEANLGHMRPCLMKGSKGSWGEEKEEEEKEGQRCI